MGKYRSCVLVCFFVVLLAGQIGVASDIATIETNNKASTTPSRTAIVDYVVDPDFSTEPEVVREGTSDEFSSSYHQAIDENDFNYVELTWNHTAGTSLNFTDEPDDGLPDCFDFIYMYQEFEWQYNEIPNDVEFMINYSPMFTGSFYTEGEGPFMFTTMAWLIDSSGNWMHIFQSSPSFDTTFRDRRVQFDYFTMWDVFQGMIENATGYQEDPEDAVKIAIGLAPTIQFHDDINSEDDPWEYYNGSVSIRVKGLGLYGIIEEDPHPSSILSPLYNSTWTHSVREVFPEVPKEFENSTNWFEDMTVAPDGSIYVLALARSSYDYYSAERKYFSYHYLLKYNSELNLVWARHNQNDTYGHGITFHDGYIFTTGSIRNRETSEGPSSLDVLVTKWSPYGDVVWETQWGGFDTEDGQSIGVSLDGSIYVCALYESYYSSSGLLQSHLLKFSPSGTFLWNKTFDTLHFSSNSQIEMRPDGMYSWDGSSVEKLDFNGEVIWSINQRALAVNYDDRGNIFIAIHGYYIGGPGEEYPLILSKWNTNGEKLWQSNYTYTLNDGWPWMFVCRSIDIAPDGSIIALLHGSYRINDYRLVKFDPEGNFLWDTIVEDEHWPYYGQREPKLEIADNGIAYFGFTRLGDFRYEIAVSAYVIGPITPYAPIFEISPTLIIVGISGAAIGIVAVVIYKQKYQ